MKPVVDSERLSAELDTLAGFSDVPAPAVTRVVFSAVDLAARRWFKGLCAEAGLDTREDAVGNTYARWHGADPDLPAVATGSHFDAIPHSGRYDGTVGVLGGLEAIRALRRAGHRPRRSVELILFTSEEPTRFGIGCLGSRLMSGSLAPESAASLEDRDGKTLEEVRTEAGFLGPLAGVALGRDRYHAFVELHIEQGPLLEREEIPLGIVTAIAAPASLRIEIEGEGGHAGAVLMPDRRDAFLAACEIALAVEAAARGTGSIDTVGTVGVCDVFPGVVNGVPSRVRIDVDVRDIELARRDGVLAAIEGACRSIGAARRVRVASRTINRDAPATCSPLVTQALSEAAASAGLPYRTMVSRAYHDSSFMAEIAPTGMLFIPCRAGVSHRPDEFASAAGIALGVEVLAGALQRLSA